MAMQDLELFILLNGLYDAKLDKAPVLAISGQVETDLLGTDFSKK